MKCEQENITLHYETFGEGIPIIMLHGWPIDHRVMLAALEPIFEQRAGWKRVYVDLPGMGKSPGMDWINNQDQVLEIVSAFVEKVVGEERFAVAGFSYGGYLGRGLVLRKPQAMLGLLLIASLIQADETDQDLPSPTTLVEDPALLAELSPELAEAFRGLAVVQSRELLDAMRTYSIPARKIADYKFLDRLRQNYAYSFDVDDLPEPFGGPTLMVMGRQDAICGYRDAFQILENYPRGSLLVLDRAGHGLMVEQRTLFEAAVNEWLDRVEEYRGTLG